MTTTVPMRFPDAPLLWTVTDVVTPEEARAEIAWIEAAQPALATNNAVYRDQDRVMRDDADVAARLFARLRPTLPTQVGGLALVGLNERLRFYRYRPGQQFPPHTDHWHQETPTRISLFSVVVYLNDGFGGGETAFLEQIDRVVTPVAGTAAIFQHKVRHEGRQVTSGTKYAFRTDVMYEAPTPIVLTRAD